MSGAVLRDMPTVPFTRELWTASLANFRLRQPFEGGGSMTYTFRKQPYNEASFGRAGLLCTGIASAGPVSNAPGRRLRRPETNRIDGSYSRFGGIICLLLILTGKPAVAQVPIDPRDAAKEKPEFERASSLPTLKCEFRVIEPFLDFGLRYESGYSLRFPLRQTSGKDHGIEVVLRFEAKSDAGGPAYRTDLWFS